MSSRLGPFCNDYSYGTLTSKELILKEDSARVYFLSPAIAFVSLIIAVGIPTNAIVLLVYLRQGVSYGTVKYYLVAVSMYDLSECCLGMIFEVFDLFYNYTFEMPVTCKFFNFTIAVANCGSTCTLLFLNYDLYKRIVEPLADQVTPDDQLTAVIAIFVGSLVFCSPLLAIFGNKDTKIKSTTGYDCGFRTKLRDSYWPVLTVGAVLALWVLVFITMCYMHVHLGREIWTQSRWAASTTQSVSRETPRPDAAYVAEKQIKPSSARRNSPYVEAFLAFDPRRIMGPQDAGCSNDYVHQTHGAVPEWFRKHKLASTCVDPAAKNAPVPVVAAPSHVDSIVLESVVDKEEKSLPLVAGAGPLSEPRGLEHSAANSTSQAPPRSFCPSLSIPGLSSWKSLPKLTREVVRVIVMMVLSVFMFCLSTVPFLVFLVLWLAARDLEQRVRCDENYLPIYHICMRSYFLSAAVNPFLYSYSRPKFRYVLCKFWEKLFRLEKRG